MSRINNSFRFTGNLGTDPEGADGLVHDDGAPGALHRRADRGVVQR